MFDVCHREVHPKYIPILGADSKAYNYRFIYAGSTQSGETFREGARIGKGNARWLTRGSYLSSLSQSRLDYFEEVRGIEGFV